LYVNYLGVYVRALEDEDMNGKFGLPSCAMLVEKVNQQGKRKRLAEAVKGVCSILGLPRAVKHVLATEKMRLNFTKLIYGTDRLVSSLPQEEMQKIVHYRRASQTRRPYRAAIRRGGDATDGGERCVLVVPGNVRFAGQGGSRQDFIQPGTRCFDTSVDGRSTSSLDRDSCVPPTLSSRSGESCRAWSCRASRKYFESD
jgi:hypothetical protein